MKKRLNPSIAIAAALTAGAGAWVLSGDLEQAKRYYAGETQTIDSDYEIRLGEASPEARTLVIDRRPSVRVRHSAALPHQRDITLLGQTDIIKDATVTAETSGQITRLEARKGQWLNKGDVILRIDMKDRLARLREAEARVRYETIGFEAARKLAGKKFQSEVRLAEEASELEEARAELASIELDIGHTIVRAPIGGFLETLPFGVGDYLDEGDAIVDIVDPNPLRVIAQVSERDVGAIAVGDKAKATTPGGGTYEGTIKFISRRAQELTRTFRVDIWFDNPDYKLRQGQTMEVTLNAGDGAAHKVSPAILTLDDAGRVGVKTVNGDSEVVFLPVTILSDGKDGMWLGGLPDTIRLITVGQEFVSDGQAVRAVDEGDTGDGTS